MVKYPCPCCGRMVFDAPPGSNAVCPVCEWQDDALALEFPTTVAGGEHDLTLYEAQKSHDVKPGTYDVDPAWRAIDMNVDEFEDVHDPSARRAPPGDTTLLYYWRATFWRLLILLAVLAVPMQAQKDVSPHRIGYVARDGGRQQYLDWGGRGPLLLLIHGWSSNAHIFDDLAPRLTSRYHVVGLTLRGFGASDTVPADYTLRQYAEDVVAVLDRFRAPTAAIAGHSFAGWVMTETALAHPARIGQLVYLDAAFDLRASDSVVARRPVKRPPLASAKTANDVIAWLTRNFFGIWTPALDAEYHARPADEDVRARQLAKVGEEAKQASTDWSRLKVPALAICAVAEVSSEFPWLGKHDAQYAAAERYVVRERRPFQRRECERFRTSASNRKTIELPGHHYVFIWHPAEVAEAIRDFVPAR